MPLANVSRSPRDSRSSSRMPSRISRSIAVLDALRVLGQRLEVARVEGLAQDRRDREEVAQLLGQPLDALLDGLLDRRRQGVGRDLGLLREAPGAGVVPRDAARLDERADELLREEGVSLGRVAQPLRELVRDLRRADERLDERAVLRGGEGRKRQGDETRDRPRRSRASASAGAACPSRSDGSCRRSESAWARGGERCTGGPRSRFRRHGGSRGSGRGACRRRCAPASGREARRSGCGPRPSASAAGTAIRESPPTAARSSAIFGELREERDQVGGEVREVRPLARGCLASRARK